MQEQLFYKKCLFSLSVCGVLIILIIPIKSFSQEINSDLLRLNRHLTLHRDSVTSGEDEPNARLPLKGVVNFSFGLGYHDNLTKAKSWTGPEAKTSNTYWNLYIEAGGAYKRTSARIFVNLMMPIPRSKDVSGYNHKAELFSDGILIDFRLLSMKSNVNFTPIIGHKLLREIANIYDPQGVNPDSLKLGYSDNGMLFGLESQFTLHRSDERTEYRLVLGYLHEQLRLEVNRYKVEFRFLQFPYVGEIIDFDQFGYISVSLEHTKWSTGRSDWFIMGSFVVELR